MEIAEQQQQQRPQIQIKVADEDLKGRYSNNAQVTQNKEEIVIDFMLVTFPAGALVSRVAMSPGHAKRLAKVLFDALKRYEEQTGRKVEEAEEPEQKFGFKPN